MYSKFTKTFIGKNISKFLLIIFCISLSLTGFLVSDNLVNNIQRLIWNEAKPILGWDIKLEWRGKLNNEQLTYLDWLEKSWTIDLSEKIQTFSTIIDKFWEPQLVSLIFVEDNYPLYGDYIVRKKEVEWVWYAASQSVVDILEKDWGLTLFEKRYKTAGIIEKFPEAAVNFYDEGKKVVLPLSEFQWLWIDQLWSRIEREYLIKVINPWDFENVLSRLEDNPLFSTVQIRDYKSGWNTFNEIFKELDNYIKYIVIVSFLLTILIIFLSVESFYIGNKRSFAILKILGLRTKKFLFFNIVLFSIIYIVSYIISIILSNITFSYIRTFEVASDFYIIPSSLLSVWLLWLTILSISVFIPLIKFFSNPPLAWLKENFLQVYSKKEILFQTFIVALWLAIIYRIWIWSFREALEFSLVFLWIIFALSLMYKFILYITYKLFKNTKNTNFNIYDSIRNTIKPWNLSLLISWSFLISFTTLLFISIISLNFLNTLNIDLSDNKNVYVINIPEADREKIGNEYFDDTFSVILARISKINTLTLWEYLWDRWDSGRFTREFNITDNALKDVPILQGKPIKPGEVSVDDDFSKTLKLKIWDTIEFSVYWKKKVLQVANIRKSGNTSVQPFFYFQVHSDDFKNFPKNYFLSTYVAPEQMSDFKKDLLAKTGDYISFIEIEEIITEIKSISQKVLIVIQILFSYVFIFCIVSLLVSVVFLIPFKQKKSKLYHILWASKTFIQKNNIFEYAYLQILASIISLSIATWAGYFVLWQSDFINFSWLMFWWALFISGIIAISIFGIIYYLVARIKVTWQK